MKKYRNGEHMFFFLTLQAECKNGEKEGKGRKNMYCLVFKDRHKMTDLLLD